MEREDKQQFQTQKLIDPDPMAIALNILGAIAQVGILLGQKAIDDYRDQKERKRHIRNLLYSLYRSTAKLQGVLKTFSSYATQYNFWSKEIRMGHVHLWVDEGTLAEIRRMYEDIHVVGMSLSDTAMNLANLLDNEDFEKIAYITQDINTVMSEALVFTTYKDFIIKTSRLLQAINHLSFHVGEKYGFEPRDDFYYDEM